MPTFVYQCTSCQRVAELTYSTWLDEPWRDWVIPCGLCGLGNMKRKVNAPSVRVTGTRRQISTELPKR